MQKIGFTGLSPGRGCGWKELLNIYHFVPLHFLNLWTIVFCFALFFNCLLHLLTMYLGKAI